MAKIRKWDRANHNVGTAELMLALRRRGMHGPEKRTLSHPDFLYSHFRRWRKSRNISQLDLAIIFNVSQSAISTWCRGSRSMPSDLIECLAIIDDELRRTFDLDGYLAGYVHGLDQWKIPITLERTPLERPRFAALREQARKSGELEKEQTKSNPANPIKFDPFIK